MERVGQIFRKGLYKNIKAGISENSGTFLVTYTALSSRQMDDFRKNMKRLGAEVFVSKNRIARLALKELSFDGLADLLSGQTAFAWSNEDAVAISKALVGFAKDWEGFQVKGGLLDGLVLSRVDVQRLADLPPKEVLQAQLLATIIAPLTRLAGALNAKSRELLSILKQYSEKKGGS